MRTKYVVCQYSKLRYIVVCIHNNELTILVAYRRDFDDIEFVNCLIWQWERGVLWRKVGEAVEGYAHWWLWRVIAALVGRY